jgi:hypothetical protein
VRCTISERLGRRLNFESNPDLSLSATVDSTFMYSISTEVAAMSREVPRNNFATVYVTVASVLIGLALEDLVSIVRRIEHRDALVWLATVFVVHIIMNAWLGYSSVAISVNLELNPWDALNVFLLPASHFVLNSCV